MRCREVRTQIDGILSRTKEDIDDAAKSHVKQCSKCRAEYAAVQTLRESYNNLEPNLEVNKIPFETMKKNVVQESLAYRDIQKFPFGMKNYSLAIGLAGAVVVILFLTLVPFKYDQTIGYKVAFAGVDQSYVNEDHAICDLLYNIGLLEADVDYQGCAETCSLTVIDLKSEAEANLVIAALNDAHPDAITSTVTPIRATTTATLLDKANEKILK